jgi:hypothetical protein
MKRVTRFQEGGSVEAPMTAAERRRQNMQRQNERRSANRISASERAEVERFNERMRQGTLTPDDMRRMGGRSEIERFSERAQRGTLTADDMRRMGGTPIPQAGGGGQGGGGGGEGGRSVVPSSGDRLPAPRPSSGELMRQGAGMGAGAPRAGGPRVVGGAPGIAAAGIALGLTGEALRRYIENQRNRPITGDFERGMEPEGSQEAADAYAAEEQSRQQRSQRPAAPAQERRSRPAPRPSPRRNAEPEGTQAAADAERERQRAAAPAEERGFFERLGLRRTNETGMDPATLEHRRNYLGSGAADTHVSYNMKGGVL